MPHFPFRSLLAAAVFGGALTAAAAPQLTVSADREKPIYRGGETVTFTAAARNEDGTPATGIQAELVVRLDGQKILQKTPVNFDAANPVEVKFQRSEPGFVIAQLEKIKGVKPPRIAPAAGAAFNPEKLRVSTPCPPDFQEFWETGRQALADHPVELSELEHNDVRTLYQISVEALRGERYCGYLSVPRGKGPFPVYLSIPGAGPGAVGVSGAIDAGKVIVAALNVHKFPGSRDAKEQRARYAEYNKKLGHSYYYDRWEDRDQHHFRNVILAFDRIFTALAERPDFNGRFVIDGSSQGGALTLILAAWNPHVTAVAANVPDFCDRIVRRNHDAPAENLPNLDQIMQTLSYYETGNFTRGMRPEVAVLTSCGYLDRGCPAGSIYAVFNQCPARDKTIFDMPLSRHEMPKAYIAYKQPWVNARLGLTPDAPAAR